MSDEDDLMPLSNSVAELVRDPVTGAWRPAAPGLASLAQTGAAHPRGPILDIKFDVFADAVPEKFQENYKRLKEILEPARRISGRRGKPDAVQLKAWVAKKFLETSRAFKFYTRKEIQSNPVFAIQDGKRRHLTIRAKEERDNATDAMIGASEKGYDFGLSVGVELLWLLQDYMACRVTVPQFTRNCKALSKLYGKKKPPASGPK